LHELVLQAQRRISAVSHIDLKCHSMRMDEDAQKSVSELRTKRLRAMSAITLWETNFALRLQQNRFRLLPLGQT
jgi:hypothetical protein